MKIFVAGATGAIGRQLVPMLVANGHEVAGMTRTPSKTDALRAMGARPVVADAFDRAAVADAVASFEPEVIVHELTALRDLDLRRFARTFAVTNRLRTEGTDHLLAAGKAVGIRRFVSQSFAGWPFARQGGPIKTEGDPLDPDPPAELASTLDAIRYLEASVIGASWMEGVVLRYGGLYGPGTSADGPDSLQFKMVRRRMLPIIGDGGGVWSFVHVADAAEATALAAERGTRGIYHIVDDEPARVAEWLPAVAVRLGAKRPLRIPRWVGRLVAGEAATVMMTEIRGASNANAKAGLGWEPRHPTWRTSLAGP